MTNALPFFVSIVFILTTIVTVGFVLFAIIRAGREKLPARLLGFLVCFWLLFTAVMSLYGFYTVTESVPPRIFVAGVLPALIVGFSFLAFFRNGFLDRFQLRVLTLLHTVRIPVELVLFWLFEASLVPRVMTFEGLNLDIVSGITAPIVAWLAFRGGKVNRPLLIVWNLLALGLLLNIVVTAFFAFPSPLQQIAFDQPNRGVMFFPYIWLPAFIVPTVLFAHLISLWQLMFRPADKQQ